MVKQRYILDSETGEIVNVLMSGDRIIRSASIDAVKKFEQIPEAEQFTKLYHEVQYEIKGCGLSASAFVVFLHLSLNLRYKSNVAKYINGKFMTRTTIEKDLELDQSTIHRAVMSLIKNGLIVEAYTTEGRVFIVNPYIAMIGDKVNRTVFDLFRKTKWARW